MRSLFAHAHAAASGLLLGLLLLLLGCGGLSRLSAEAPPPVWVTVELVYPGASAQDIEALIVVPLEAEVLSVEGVEEISALSELGRGALRLRMAPDADAYASLSAVRDRVDAAQSLPADAEPPMLRLEDAARGLSVALRGDDLGALSQAAETVKARLEREPGVTRVEVLGVEDSVVEVQAHAQRLMAAGVSPGQLTAALSGQEPSRPGAGYVVRSAPPSGDIEALGGLVLNAQGLRVSDLASLSTRARVAQPVYLDGTQAVLLEVAFADSVSAEEARAQLATHMPELDGLQVWTPGVAPDLRYRLEGPDAELTGALQRLSAAAQPAQALTLVRSSGVAEVRIWGAPGEPIDDGGLVPGLELTPLPEPGPWAVISGEDRAALWSVAEALSASLASSPEVAAVRGGGRAVPEQVVTFDRAAAARLGVSTHVLAEAMRWSGGHRVHTAAGQTLEVALHGLGALDDPQGVRLLLEVNGELQVIPLSAVAEVALQSSPLQLWRWQGQPAVRLSVRSAGDASATSQAVEAAVEAQALPEGVVISVSPMAPGF